MPTAPERAGLPAGLRYLLQHGHAADGSHGDNTESTQHLVNPPTENPTTNDAVDAWIRGRVQADQQMRSAKEAS